MAPEEVIEALDAMQHNDDPESAHGCAEDILCDFLRAQGYSGVAEAFESARDRVGFWYA